MADPETMTSVLEAPPVLARGRRLAGRYRLERRLGSGGMASVWLADDELLRRPVAIKMVGEDVGDAEFLRRFRREAKLAAGLQHPNLVSIYDYRAEERPYLVMEYIEGGSLADRIALGDAPPVEPLAHQLLEALRCIHAAGILHRDVKPENVLLDADGRARLTDFGIARPAGGTAITRVGEVMGTQGYLAPELLRGEPATERSDLYALGVLLARVSGYGGGAFCSFVEHLRDPEPERRPASATAALAMLERATAPQPGTATQRFELGPAATAAPPAAPRRRLWARALALAGLGLVLLAVVALAVGGGDDQSAGGGKTRASTTLADANRSPGDSSGHADGAESGAAADSPAPAPEKQPVDGAALNDQGYALIQAGRAEEAVPILQRAVDALRKSGDELTYNYALFNLGSALVAAGRPEEAIPILEQRLEYPNQQEVVAAELERARAAASDGTGGVDAPPGAEEGGGVEAPKPEKPGKGPKHGKVPPPFEDGE